MGDTDEFFEIQSYSTHVEETEKFIRQVYDINGSVRETIHSIPSGTETLYEEVIRIATEYVADRRANVASLQIDVLYFAALCFGIAGVVSLCMAGRELYRGRRAKKVQ